MSLVELDVCATSEVLGTSVDDGTSLVGPSVEVGFADRVLVGESVLTGSELMTSVVGETVGSRVGATDEGSLLDGELLLAGSADEPLVVGTSVVDPCDDEASEVCAEDESGDDDDEAGSELATTLLLAGFDVVTIGELDEGGSGKAEDTAPLWPTDVVGGLLVTTEPTETRWVVGVADVVGWARELCLLPPDPEPELPELPDPE